MAELEAELVAAPSITQRLSKVLMPQPLTEEARARKKPLRDLVLSKNFINVSSLLVICNAVLMMCWTPYNSDAFHDACAPHTFHLTRLSADPIQPDACSASLPNLRLTRSPPPPHTTAPHPTTDDVLHWVFSALFFVELVLRVRALGTVVYFKDPFRTFDAVLVAFTAIDVLALIGAFDSEAPVVRGLRGFRVMRLVRPLSRIPAFQLVVVATFKSLDAIGAIGVVLVTYLFMMAILAMNLLGGIYGEEGVGVHGVRYHFDNFVISIATIWYAVLTENWTGVMYAAYGAADYPGLVLVFFLFVITVGNFVILNMFLAVLLDRMAAELEEQREAKSRGNQVEEMQMNKAAETMQKAVRFVLKLKQFQRKALDIKISSNNLGTLMSKEDAAKYPFVSGWEVAAYKTMWDTATLADDGEVGDFQTAQLPHFMRMIGQPLMTGGKRDKEVGAKVIAKIREFDANGDGKICFSEFLAIVNDKRSIEVDKGYVDWDDLDEDVTEEDLHVVSLDGDDDTHNKRGGEHKKSRQERVKGLMGRRLAKLHPGIAGTSKSAHMLLRNFYLEQPLVGTVCGGLGPDSKLRRTALYIYYSQTKQAIVLFFVLAAGSSAGAVFAQKRTAAGGWPEEDIGFRTDLEKNMGTDAFDGATKFLDGAFWLCLTGDVVLRFIIGGLWVDPKRGYFRPSSTNPGLCWRVQDLVVAFFTFFSLVFPMPETANNGARVYKTVQSLRLLTVIPRIHRMKVMAGALMSALPQVGMLAVGLLLVLISFGVMGVFMFGGAFGFCTDDHGNLPTPDVVNNRSQCEDMAWQGYAWNPGATPGRQNFDNLGFAMLSLFQTLFVDGWSGIMYAAMDARGFELQPDVENAYFPSLLYFWAFTFIGTLFFLNLVIGAICSTFDELVKADSGMDELTDDQRRWVYTQRVLQAIRPRPELVFPPGKGFRYRCFVLCAETNPVPPPKGSKEVPQPKTYGSSFNAVIMTVVIVNLTMMLMYTKDTDNENATRLYSFLSLTFATVYLVEFVIKLAGLGFNQYWSDRWNRLDAFLMFFQLVSAGSSAMIYLSGGGGSSVNIGFFRVLRIFRLSKYNKSLRMIANTVMLGMPALLNISALLYVILFVFAMLGMTLFGGMVQADDCRFSIHAHFDTIFAGYETVFRLATGDSWSCLYLDAQRLEFPEDIDTPHIFWVHAYFIVFMLTSLLLLSVFVGIVMEYYGIQASLIVTQRTAEIYNERWNTFDRKNTSYISVDQIGRLILSLGDPLSPLPPHRAPLVKGEKKDGKKGKGEKAAEAAAPAAAPASAPSGMVRERASKLDDETYDRMKATGEEASAADYVRDEFGKVVKIRPGSPTETQLRLMLAHLKIPVRQGKLQFIEVVCALAEYRDGQPIPRSATKVRTDLLTKWPERSPTLLTLPPQEGISNETGYVDEAIAVVTGVPLPPKKPKVVKGVAVANGGGGGPPSGAGGAGGRGATAEEMLSSSQMKAMPSLAMLSSFSDDAQQDVAAARATAMAHVSSSGIDVPVNVKPMLALPPPKASSQAQRGGDEYITTSAPPSDIGSFAPSDTSSVRGAKKVTGGPKRYKTQGGLGMTVRSGLMSPPTSQPPSEIGSAADAPRPPSRHEVALLKAWASLRADFMCEDAARQLAALIMLRKLLVAKVSSSSNSDELSMSIKRVVAGQMVPRFVQFLQADEASTISSTAVASSVSTVASLQYEAAHVLDICCADVPACGQLLVESGAVPVLVQHVRAATAERLAAQAMRLLGTIANTAPDHRELILMQGAMTALLSRLAPSSSLDALRAAARCLACLSGFRHGGAEGTWALLASALKVVPHLLRSQDAEIQLDCCRVLAAMTQEPKAARHAGMVSHDKVAGERVLFQRIDSVVELRVLPRIAALMGAPIGTPLATAALRVAANVAAGEDHQTQAVVDAGVLSRLMPLLLSPDVEAVKDSCWLVSNVLAGTDAQVQAVLDSGVMPALVRLVGNTDHTVATRQQAAWCIINVADAAKIAQVANLAEVGCVKSLCDLLVEPQVLPNPMAALNALARLCRHEERSVEAITRVDVYKLRMLQGHPSPEVQRKAHKLLRLAVMSPAVLSPMSGAAGGAAGGSSRKLLTHQSSKSVKPSPRGSDAATAAWLATASATEEGGNRDHDAPPEVLSVAKAGDEEEEGEESTYEEEPTESEAEVLMEQAWEEKWGAQGADGGASSGEEAVRSSQADKIIADHFESDDPLADMLASLGGGGGGDGGGANEEPPSPGVYSVHSSVADAAAIALEEVIVVKKGRRRSSKQMAAQRQLSAVMTSRDFEEIARRCLELGTVGEAEYDAATDAIARGRSTEAGIVSLWAPRLRLAEKALDKRAELVASRAASSVGSITTSPRASPRAMPTEAPLAPPAPMLGDTKPSAEEGGFLGSVANLFAPKPAAAASSAAELSAVSAEASPSKPELKREGTSMGAAWLMLDAIKKELELPPDLSKQRTIKLALERCGLSPAATIAEDVVNVANFLEISSSA